MTDTGRGGRGAQAAVCKTAYTGANPVRASIINGLNGNRASGGMADAKDLKSFGLINRESSSLSSPTRVRAH